MFDPEFQGSFALLLDAVKEGRTMFKDKEGNRE